jgi:hypothetical protein
VGKILYGGSIEWLDRNDLFVIDRDHSAACEGRECKIVAPKLTPGAFVPGTRARSPPSDAGSSRDTAQSFCSSRTIQKVTDIAAEPAFPTKRF